MKKLKHKKQKNVGLIYEILIKKVSQDLINESKEKTAQHLLEKYFNKYTDIYKENKIYQIVLNSAGKSYSQISKNISESLNITKTIDKEKILTEKYNLVGEILENFGEKFFNTEVRNYKEFASIYKLIEVKRVNNLRLSPGEALIIENSLIESLENNSKQKGLEETTSTLEEYCEGLDENRRELVLNMFSKDFPDFKTNLIEEFYSIRENINQIINSKNNINKVEDIKIQEVMKKNKDMIETIKESKEFDSNIMSHLFKMYELEETLRQI